MKKAVIFVHIPKTAGTSFARILRENYFLWDKRRVYWQDYQVTKPITEMTPKERRRLDVIHGHFSFGMHELLDSPFSYVTFLRDPVKRMLSFYNYILVTPEHYLHKQVAEQGMSIMEFFQSGMTKELDNLQVRMLQGDEHAIPFGEVDEAHLALAKKNIEAHFPVVGLTEYFDESLLLIRDRLWKLFPFYVRANQVKKEKPKLDEDLVQLIREQNQYDILLYEWAEQRLLKQVAEAGSGFPPRLDSFRKMNRLFGALISLLPIYKKC
jgi:hypothetical protein